MKEVVGLQYVDTGADGEIRLRWAFRSITWCCMRRRKQGFGCAGFMLEDEGRKVRSTVIERLYARRSRSDERRWKNLSGACFSCAPCGVSNPLSAQVDRVFLTSSLPEDAERSIPALDRAHPADRACRPFNTPDAARTIEF